MLRAQQPTPFPGLNAENQAKKADIAAVYAAIAELGARGITLDMLNQAVDCYQSARLRLRQLSGANRTVMVCNDPVDGTPLVAVAGGGGSAATQFQELQERQQRGEGVELNFQQVYARCVSELLFRPEHVQPKAGEPPFTFYASHADKKLALYVHSRMPDAAPRVLAMGDSRDMCRDCQAFFHKFAVVTGHTVIVTDPCSMRVFCPDRTVITIFHAPPGSLYYNQQEYVVPSRAADWETNAADHGTLLTGDPLNALRQNRAVVEHPDGTRTTYP